MSVSLYIWTYIAFAALYLVCVALLLSRMLKIGSLLRKITHSDTQPSEPSTIAPPAILDGAQRVIDYSQMQILLPLTYVVVSMFLGSFVLRSSSSAELVNGGWIAASVLATATAVYLTWRSWTAAGSVLAASADRFTDPRLAAIASPLSRRLKGSAFVLALVALFVALNLWAVAAGLDRLLSVDFLL